MRVTAISLVCAPGAVTASTVTRTLAGPIVLFGALGRTSAGLLKVAPGALKFPTDLTRVKLTREHDRAESRGHLVDVQETPEGIRVAAKVSDGPDGDDALREAADKTRDGFSFDVVDAVIDGDTITAAEVIAVGQVGIPAFDDMRIDSIAASNQTPAGEPGTTTGGTMTAEQRRRLAELLAQQTLSTEERAELDTLTTLAAQEAVAQVNEPAEPAEPAAAAPAAPAATAVPVAASIPVVPAGVPSPAPARTAPAGGAFRAMVRQVTAGLRDRARGGSGMTDITAALADVTHSEHTTDIEQVAWSGELWHGLEYEPLFSDLLTRDTLTYFEGKGWRFVTTPELQDYAGDKAEIPTGEVVTEPSEYEAARMAVGVDVDRKFYDFPNEAFVSGLFERVRETWEIKLDAKARAYILAQATAATRPLSVTKTNGDATITAANGSFSAADVGATITGTGIPANTTILSVTNSGSAEMSANATTGGTITAQVGAQAGTVLKAAARVGQTLKRTRVGRMNWVVLNDEDMFTLLDINEQQVPVFLKLWGIEPENFRSSPDVPAGTIIGGVRQAAKLRTLPGSPIRVDAQNLANGGVDTAFFGYWAIEEHHPTGIVSARFNPAA